MATLPLDVENLLGEIKGGAPEWTGAPDDSMVGHVHLRVGNAAEAELWWNQELGFDTMVELWRQRGVSVDGRLSPSRGRQFLAERGRQGS